MMAAPDDANTAPLKILCTLGLRGVMMELAPSIAASGLPFAATYESTNAILRRLASGEQADIAILIDTTVDELIKAGTLRPGSRRDIARSGVAIAVRAGAPKPDISTAAAFKRALLAARSIAYTKSGASGLYFASLIERLGIAEEINRKARIQDGLVGELAARGEAEIAVQQASELLPVAGIDIVGPLPDELQKMTVFSAGIFATTRRSDEAKALIERLAAPAAEKVVRDKGLEPASMFV
jgi:molybdate transport system substrate-binding protein